MLAAALIACAAATLDCAAQSINPYAGDGTAGYAGDGAAATSAWLDQPHGLAMDANGHLYVADTTNGVVRKVDVSTGNISTYAGGGSLQTGDGTAATSAWMKTPGGVVVDGAGNTYIADTGGHRIRKITVGTGLISTIGGTGVAGFSGDGGAATSAQIDTPRGIALDSTGNVIFADSGNHRIRKITTGGVISTIAGTGTAGHTGDGGAATSAQISGPYAVRVDASDNVYFADTGNHCLRTFLVGGNISTIVGTGTQGFSGDGGVSTSAKLSAPEGIAFSDTDKAAFGNTTAHATQSGDFVGVQVATKINIGTAGTVTSATFYVDGPVGHDFRFALYDDSAGEPNTLLVESAIVNPSSSPSWHTITVADTAVTPGDYWIAIASKKTQQNYHYTATGGETREVNNNAITGSFTDPWGTSDASNNRIVSGYASTSFAASVVYIADTGNHRVRKAAVGGNISTIAGTGTAGDSGDGGLATSAKIDTPGAVEFDQPGDVLIADTGNHRVRKLTLGSGTIAAHAGTGTRGYAGDGGAATLAEMDAPAAVFTDSAGNLVIADTGNHAIRKLTVSTGTIALVAGTPLDYGIGDGNAATSTVLDSIEDLAVDAAGNLFIASTALNRIRKVSTGGTITTVAGTGAAGFAGDGAAATAAVLSQPAGIEVDVSDNLYIADTANSRIRKVTAATGFISTYAGTGVAGDSGDGGLATAAQVNVPEGVCVDENGDVFVADTGNHRVRKITDATGNIAAFAGTGTAGYTGDGGAATSATMNAPVRVGVDTRDTAVIVERGNHVVRKVDSAGVIDTLAGTGLAGDSGDGGAAAAAQVDSPAGLGFKRSGFSYLYVADTANNRVRYVTIGLNAVRVLQWAEVRP